MSKTEEMYKIYIADVSKFPIFHHVYEVPVHFIREETREEDLNLNSYLTCLFNEFGFGKKERARMIKKSIAHIPSGTTYIAKFKVPKKDNDRFLDNLTKYYKKAVKNGYNFERTSNYLKWKYPLSVYEMRLF